MCWDPPSSIPQMAANPTLSQAPAQVASEDLTAQEATVKYIEITSPIIGTFYRRPAPDKPVFVEVGDVVSPNTVVCMVEAMKLFNEIESEVSGKIVKILVEDGTPVEYGQPIFLVDPS